MYETFGNSTNSPLLIVAGFSRQMVDVDENFCTQLAACGFWVIRFDNRDVGVSTHCHHLGIPNISDIMKTGEGEQKYNSHTD